MTVKGCTFYVYSLYFSGTTLTIVKGSSGAVSSPVSISGSVDWSYRICVYPYASSIFLFIEPFACISCINVSPLCIHEWIFELINWLSGAVFVCHMFLVFIILWKGSQYLFQCHLEHHYFFHFCDEKLLKYPFMLDVVDQLEIR